MKSYFNRAKRENDFVVLIKHKKLYEEYKDSKEFLEIKNYTQKIRSYTPYFKDIYDNLECNCSYEEYIEEIQKDKKYLIIENVVRGIYKRVKYIDCLKLLLIHMTYVGFIVEDIIKDSIKENYKVKSSKKLDNKQKIDILVENKIGLQIKNSSFLEGQYLEQRLIYYREYKELNFIFYDIDDALNINFVSIGGESIIPLQKVVGFIGREYKGIEEIIEELKSKLGC